ncbi:MAG: cysteine desulfurase family protein [Candidatus Magasanikbacteria bacterium]
MPSKKIQKRKSVYLDHAATTPVREEVLDAMMPYFTEKFANPSGIYAEALTVRRDVDDARKTIAQILGTQADSIFFTSGGTESCNTALFGVARKNVSSGKHIITTKMEHHAVLHPMEKLEKEGYEITYLSPDKFGFVSAKQVREALRPDTILVSIMYANNEIGTVLPIADIGKEIIKWRKENNIKYPYFHTDACQAGGVLDVSVEKLHVDLLTLNASKLYGPKGVGLLYKRRGVQVEQMMYGGGQEMKFRAGTENVPGIMGFAKALELAQKEKEEENARLIELRNYFFAELQKQIPKVKLNGAPLEGSDVRLPNNLNVSILDIEGEAILLYLDEYGIMCSTGSACTADSLDPSHVLISCSLSYEYAHGSIRFTLGRENTKEDIDYVMEHLPGIVEKLRKISPVSLTEDPGKNIHPKYHQR